MLDFLLWLQLPLRRDRQLIRDLYPILGFYPRRTRYYRQALLHKSSGVKAEGRYLNNERLEFLGDAILDAVVGDIVYRRYEGKREGFLTNARSKLVSRATLGKIATEIGLDRLVKRNGTMRAHNSYMAGNAFEALVGAIYLDRGYGACYRFMERRILERLVNVDRVAYREVNFKSKLIEWSQKHKIQLDFPCSEPDTSNRANPTFTTRALIEGIECGRATGYSKKESQQLAAKAALRNLKKNRETEQAVLAARDARQKKEQQG